MLRTMWPHGVLRSTAAAMAGLVAGGAVPLPAGPLAAQADAANKAKVYVFPYQQVFEGVPQAIITQTSDRLKNEIEHNDEIELHKGPLFTPEAVAAERNPPSDEALKPASSSLDAIAEAIRNNRLDRELVDAIQAQGEAIGADFVVLGGVAKAGEHFNVGSILLKVKDKSICPLPAIRFGPDMRGAAVEVPNLVSALVKRMEGCPEPANPLLRIVEPPAAPRGTAQAVSAPERRPARPGVPAQPLTQAGQPAPPPRTAATADGMATVVPSALEPKPPNLPAVPSVPQARRSTPMIKDEGVDSPTRWYASWWFWGIVGGVVAAGVAGGVLYASGAFDKDVSGASVDVSW